MFEFFYSERIAIDLTKKQVGGILKKEKMPDSVGRLHVYGYKAAACVKLGRLYFLTLSIF